MRDRRYRLIRAFAACCGWAGCGLALWGCDPAEDAPAAFPGAAFLIVAPASVQPTSPEEGTTVYIQARGGSYAGITSYGGKLRYAGLAEDATESCAELPASEPLYVLVKPDDVESLLEVRLYADCDVNEPGGTALEMCQNHDSFVKSVVVPIAVRRFNQAAYLSGDASVDAFAEGAHASVSAESSADRGDR